MDHIFSSLSGFTQVSILIIVGLAAGMHWRWSRTVAAAGPALLTTFGIFFCFAGITSGLVDFDPKDVKDSVPQLLQGIRTSFWASVFGIGCALTIKLRVLIFGDPPLATRGRPAGATIDDLAAQLVRLNRTLGGDEEASVVGQLARLRTDANERLEGLNRSFEHFAEKMVETNSRALIQALSQVVRNFNTELNEQFGENFKNLNLAVAKLVVWQRQYEQQLNSLIEQETQTRNNLADASLRYAELLDRASTFADTAESLRELVAHAKAHTERVSA